MTTDQFSITTTCCALLLACGCTLPATAADDAPPAGQPQQILLWPDGAPGALGETEADRPSITVHLPAKEAATGCGIVVCPGGGYGHLALDHEGRQVAEWLNSIGVAAFVLRYRLAPKYHHPAPLLDVQRALRTVRARAKEWRLDPSRVGVLGFSAGGHLASTAGTHYDSGLGNGADSIDRVSCRPDFLILCYPVISLTSEFTHKGSRRNLLGNEPDPALVELLSNELQVTADTPPTFLFHTTEDKGVPPQNSVLFYLALRKHQVPAEMHIYERGRHGLGLAAEVPGTSSWPNRCQEWMQGRGLLGEAAQ